MFNGLCITLLVLTYASLALSCYGKKQALQTTVNKLCDENRTERSFARLLAQDVRRPWRQTRATLQPSNQARANSATFRAVNPPSVRLHNPFNPENRKTRRRMSPQESRLEAVPRVETLPEASRGKQAPLLDKPFSPGTHSAGRHQQYCSHSSPHLRSQTDSNDPHVDQNDGLGPALLK
ncbi:hypothetical protein MHYP_G00332590 [Metynnis hypsauchen]